MRHGGFSITELLVVLAISSVVSGLFAAFQIQMAVNTQVTKQKLDAAEFGRTLGQAMADERACTCNFRDLPIVADPSPASGTFHADLPANRPLTIKNFDPDVKTLNCLASVAAENVLAQTGAALPYVQSLLQVSRIRLANLKPTNASSVNGTEYTGVLEIAFAERADHQPVPAPTQIQKKFFVSDDKIVACGMARDDYFHREAADAQMTNNGALETTPSYVECPAGTKIISGGWMSMPAPPAPFPKPDCPNARSAIVRMSMRPPGTNGWVVIAQCHAVKAVALCRKPRAVRDL